MSQKDQIRGLSDDDLVARYHAMEAGTRDSGELPFDLEIDRQKGLGSPFYLASETIDPFYRDNFELKHAQLLDECLAPWIIGETVRIEGVNYNPKDYVGLIVTWPRSTYKSTCCRLILLWAYLYYKIVLGKDLTAALTHQVEQKAVDHGEGIRNVVRHNKKFRELYPEFAVSSKLDWDRQTNWRWPNMGTSLRQAGQWSWQAYGETSRKTGGHYQLRLVDDWETEDSVGTTEAINLSERRFKMMENLKVRGMKHHPWIVMGTYYHYDGPYKRLEKGGGWLPWCVPAVSGSVKTIFDLCSKNRRDPKELAIINATLKKLEHERHDDLAFPLLLSWQELYMTALGQQSEDQGELQGGFYDFSCQIMLNPIPDGEQRFPSAILDEQWVEKLPGPEQMVIYIRIDPAISKKRRNDQTAIVVGGVHWTGDRYACQTWLGHENRPTKILRRAFGYGRAWQKLGYKVVNLGIEAVAFQEAMAQSAREGVTERDAQFHGEPIPITKPPCNVVSITRGPEATKHERLMEMEGPASRREIWFWTGDPMARKLHQQFTHYPFDRFDGLDAFHDLWIKTQVPARPTMEKPTEDMTPEEILARLGIKDQNQGSMGMRNTVRLASWR